jgi:hypothetical protein
VNVKGVENREILEKAGEAANVAADAVGIKRMYVEHGGADFRMIENNWETNPRGNQYLARLQRLGEPGLLHRIRDVYQPQIQEIMDNYFGRRGMTRPGRASR